MKSGNGKIANLPEHIRNELNWRINDGDEGKELVDWLNAKPEVTEVAPGFSTVNPSPLKTSPSGERTAIASGMFITPSFGN